MMLPVFKQDSFRKPVVLLMVSAGDAVRGILFKYKILLFCNYISYLLISDVVFNSY